MDDRAVSTAMSYALSLTIVTLLVTGVFAGMTDFVDDQRERAIRSELRVLGNRVAADVGAVDRLVIADAGATAIEIGIDLPTAVASRSYRIEISDLGANRPYALNLSTSDPAVSVTVLLKVETTLTENEVSGGDLVVVYDGTAMEVRNA